MYQTSTNILKKITAIGRKLPPFDPTSIFANGVAGFHINIEEAIRLNQQAMGPELVVNGGFDDGLTGWSRGVGNSALSNTAGRIRVESTVDGVTTLLAVTLIPTVPGKTYFVQVGSGYKTANNSFAVNVSNNANGTAAFFTSSHGSIGVGVSISNISTYFVATAASSYLVLRADTGAVNLAGAYVEFDNISVREIDLSKVVAFQDSAGTLPVVSMEQPLGLILDTKAGVPVRGVELVTNGDFSDGLTGWTNTGGVTASVSDGVLSISYDSAAGGRFQDILTSANCVAVSCYVRCAAGSAVSVIGYPRSGSFSAPNTPVAVTNAGWEEKRFVLCKEAGASGFRIYFRVGSSGTVAEVKNVSVRELPGNHFVQPSNAPSRPLVSRRVNLLAATEDFAHADWSKPNATVTANAAVAPDGTLTAAKLVPTTSTGPHELDRGIPPGKTLTFSVYAKKGEYNFCTLAIRGSGIRSTRTFNLTTGEITNPYNVASTFISAQAINVGNGWWRLTISATSEDFNGVKIASAVDTTSGHTDSGQSFTGDGTSGIYIWHPDIRLAIDANLPPYQRVTSPTDYDEVGFPAYARFDGLDDWLESGVVDMTSTDEVTVIAGVTKLSDAATGSVIEFSSNAITNDGAFWLLAPSGAGTHSYRATSRGTVYTLAGEGVFAPAPDKALVAVVGKISAPFVTLRRNGTQVATSSGDQGTGNYGAYKFYMGRRDGASVPFNGRIYGVTVIGKMLTSRQLAAVEKAERQMGGLY